MLIGAMNHPAHNVFDEITWMAGMGMEFIDLTLEPPGTASWEVDGPAIRQALQERGMQVVGHTAWYIPLASSIPEVRRGAVEELCRCLDVFSQVGARWMNVHPDRHTPWHDRRFYIEKNLESLRTLIDYGRKRDVSVMIENLPGDFNSAPQLGELLDPLPELGLHLDIGHANLQVPHNTTFEILDRFGSRLRHVHLHDNKGGHADLHLPLGTGTVEVSEAIKALKRCGYDSTITLEVFSPERDYLAYSRDALRAIWDGKRE